MLAIHTESDPNGVRREPLVQIKLAETPVEIRGARPARVVRILPVSHHHAHAVTLRRSRQPARFG